MAKQEARRKAIQRQVRKYLEEDPEGVIDTILRKPFFASWMKVNEPYSRIEDDTSGTISVMTGVDSDNFIQVESKLDPQEPWAQVHRFRTWAGGGESLMVHAALNILARSIQLANAARPQTHRRQLEENRPA